MKTEIRKELERLAKENNGILQPPAVVEAASKKSSPLHSYFEWNDSEAAHAYRLWQARQLIAVVVSVVPNSKTEERVWVSLKSDQKAGGGYRTVVSVLNDDQLREQLLADALEDLRVFQTKYSKLTELAGVFKAARKFELMRKPAQ